MSLTFIGLIACSLAVASAIAAYAWPDFHKLWSGRCFFVTLLTLALFIFQWDAIRANFQLWNPDESEMIAGALTLQQRPVFWRDVDGNSHGPLNQLPLLLPALVGARIDYTSARVMAAILTVLLLVCLHSALAAQLGEGGARLLVLPAWALFIFNLDPETAQYTSELMPSLLVVLAAMLLPSALQAAKSGWWCWIAGVVCGAAPFAKLQVTPIAAWIGLFLLIALWFDAAIPTRERWHKSILLVLGAFSPALVFVGLATINGAFMDFWIRYIECNLIGYAINGGIFFNTEWPSPASIFGFSQFLWPVTGAILAGGAIALVNRHQPAQRNFIFTLGLATIALAAIYAPHRPFAHYFLLLVGPLVLLMGAVTGPTLARVAARLTPPRRAIAAILVIVSLSGFTVAHHFHHPAYFRYILRSRPAVPREAVEALQRHIRAGESLAVWGWLPGLYVMTQTISATPDVIAFWQIVPSRWQEFYHARYLQALTARPPVVFVDTTGPAEFFFQNPTVSRHENFPALQSFIARNYTLAETAVGCRVYVRSDRFEEYK